MKTVFEFGGRNPFNGATVDSMITVQQSENENALFDVHYGLQVKRMLTYKQACYEIGQVILHHLSCESIVNNEGM